MKKIMAIACASVLALALAGCASGAGSSSASASASGSASAEASASSASAEASSASAGAELANPWTDVETAEAAAEGAGLDSFNVADLKIGDLNLFEPTYRYMDGIAEAKLQGGAFEMTIRKSATVSGQELSGDYNEYPEKWTWSFGDVEVECQGYKGNMASSICWSKDGANYAVMFVGLGGENMAIGEPAVEELISALI